VRGSRALQTPPEPSQDLCTPPGDLDPGWTIGHPWDPGDPSDAQNTCFSMPKRRRSQPKCC